MERMGRRTKREMKAGWESEEGEMEREKQEWDLSTNDRCQQRQEER